MLGGGEDGNRSGGGARVQRSIGEAGEDGGASLEGLLHEAQSVSLVESLVLHDEVREVVLCLKDSGAKRDLRPPAVAAADQIDDSKREKGEPLHTSALALASLLTAIDPEGLILWLRSATRKATDDCNSPRENCNNADSLHSAE